MMIMKSLKLIAGCILLLCVTGCASTVCVLARSHKIDAKVPPFYPATACDLGVAYSCIFKNAPDGPSFDIWSGKLLWLPFALVDVPASLATDTIILPYDAYHAYRSRNTASASKQETQQSKSTTNNVPEDTARKLADPQH